MATVHDVAAYILSKQSPMSTMKLQKLVYYSQVWQLVWVDETLFDDPIEAWANGPVVYDLFRAHRGRYTAEDPWDDGSPANLTDEQRDTVDAVLATYGKLDGRQLSALTHSERPWIEAREGLRPTERSHTPIRLEVMKDFYSALDDDPAAQPIGDLNWVTA